MRRMGGTCSIQRQSSPESYSNSDHSNSDHSPHDRPFSRHSLMLAIPDDSISRLYPIEDNYVTEDSGLRTPKSLADLCVETLCRSLPQLDGELPVGLPQDVVDDVVNSLTRHNAMNATMLRTLRNCDLAHLILGGCRGVTDEWLKPFSTNESGTQNMQIDDHTTGSDERCFHVKQEEHSIAEDSSTSLDSFESAIQEEPSKEEEASVTGSPTFEEANMELDSSSVFTSTPTTVTSVTSNLTLLDLRGSQRLTDKGLRQLSKLHNLEVARLDHCHSIVGRGLIALAHSHRLHTLSLANCRRLSDEAVINISHLTSLEALSLDGCRCLTDRSLAAISGLFKLTKLDLSQCDLLSDDGLKELGSLEKLEEVSLGWCRQISDAGLEDLTSQPGRSITLRTFCVARCPITNTGVEFLARLSALEELDVNGCTNIGSAALGATIKQLVNLTNLDVSYCPGILRSSWQGNIRSLKSLELGYSGVRDSHLSRLTHLPNLEEINLDSCPIGDWSIAHLADNNVIPNIRSLDLADTDLSDLGMVHLAKFKKLTRLSLFYCNISNVGLRHLGSLISLEVLNLDSREIDDHGLRYLRNLKKLKSLDIFSGRITDSGCSHIAGIKTLESLELCGGGISDIGCGLLATLERLTSLNLCQNERISNRGAAAIAALTELKVLNLSHTRVSSNALQYFSNLTRLQSLALYGCRGMEHAERLSNLQDSLPSLQCIRRNNVSSGDGVVARPQETADESDDSDSESEVESSARIYSLSQFEESDSEMDDSDSSSSAENESVSDASSYVSEVEYD